MQPLLSIVIANYNYGRFLDEAIRSVIAQDMGDKVELIIVDGGSTDNSVEIIQKYANGLPPNISYTDWINSSNHNSQTPPLITWWCSEKDGGQSAAFNKGFSHARGRFLTWLNADDVMLPGVIDALKTASERDPWQEWFVGGVYWLDPQMNVIRCGRARHMSRIRAEYGLVNVGGPCSFFTKDLYERAGKIDERHHYTMDTDLWLRFALNENVAFKPCIRYAWGLRLHPDAKMSGHNFNADGTLAANAFSSEAQHKEEKKRKQLQFEEGATRAKLPPVKGKMNRVLSLLTADYIPALLSRFDTHRFAGQNYRKICGGAS